MTTFRVGITSDFLKPDGTLGFGDIGLDVLAAAPGVAHEFLPDCGGVIPRDVADRYDALLVLAPQVTAGTVDGCKRLTLVARFGVGYDNVDVAACTRNDVLLTITPSGVRRPVAVSALTLNVILAPHAICWTDELFRGNGQAACQSILDVAAGRVPQDVVNREAVEQPGLRQELAQFL